MSELTGTTTGTTTGIGTGTTTDATTGTGIGTGPGVQTDADAGSAHAGTNGTGPSPADTPAPVEARADIDRRLTPPRRRWPALVAGLAIGAGATWVVTTRGTDTGTAIGDASLAEVVDLATVEVERRDLIEEVDWAGTLAGGATQSVAAPVAGTITEVVGVGDAIERGGVVARVDDQPIVALFGSTPMWRDLTEGVEGADVLQLETNLAALGFNADGVVTVDTEYTAATGDMVEAWQAALGVDETGDVGTGDVVIVTGESTVAASSTVGSPARVGEELIAVETPSVQFDVTGRTGRTPDDDLVAGGSTGTVDRLAEPGTEVGHGTVLFEVDGTAVVAVIDVPPGTAAVLDAFATGDVDQIESVLVYVGHDPAGAIEIDDTADAATVAAVERWQAGAGLPATGSLDPSHYVVVPGDRAYTVGDHAVAAGDELGEGRLVMTLDSPTLSLTADVAVTEVDEFAVGDPVVVEQVDETVFAAVVTEIGDTTTQDGGATPTVVVAFEVTEPPGEYVSGSVTITTESSRIDGAIVVPTRALVTLREGGFAVEKQNADGTTTLVGIELGTFDEGVVEVTSGDLLPGDVVVVPG